VIGIGGEDSTDRNVTAGSRLHSRGVSATSAEIAARRYLFTQAQRALSADGIASPVAMSVIGVPAQPVDATQARRKRICRPAPPRSDFTPAHLLASRKHLSRIWSLKLGKTSASPYCTLVQSEPTAGVVWLQRHCAQRNFIDSCQNSLQQTAITVRLGFGHHPRNEAALRI